MRTWSLSELMLEIVKLRPKMRMDTVQKRLKNGYYPEDVAAKVGGRWKIFDKEAFIEATINSKKPNLRALRQGKVLQGDLITHAKENPVDFAAEIPQDYEKALAAKTHFQAQKEKLNYLERKGDLIDLKDAIKQTADAARVVRNALLLMPVKVAHLLQSEKDLKKIEVLLQDSIREVLTDCASQIEQDSFIKKKA